MVTRKIDLDAIYCHKKSCRQGPRFKWGALIRQAGSRLAEGLGIIETRCDKCGQRYAERTKPLCR
jgi:hypothetical protein